VCCDDAIGVFSLDKCGIYCAERACSSLEFPAAALDQEHNERGFPGANLLAAHVAVVCPRWVRFRQTPIAIGFHAKR
jgi:hypothetical protein